MLNPQTNGTREETPCLEHEEALVEIRRQFGGRAPQSERQGGSEVDQKCEQ